METFTGISVIIPALNEEIFIKRLVRYLNLYCHDDLQIIVSDGGSTDNTISLAHGEGATVVLSPKKGRAAQMNYGAQYANRSILYFVHADCLPPKNFNFQIIEAIENGHAFGRFQTKFDTHSVLLKLNAFFTRFDWFICNGGDQTLFFKKHVFQEIGGFNNELLLMEDFDIVRRARKVYRYAILKDKVLVSARKYETNSWLKVQRANYTIVKMYLRGAKQAAMFEKYKQMLDYRYG